MPWIDIPGGIEWHEPPSWMKKPAKPQFNSMRIVMAALREALEPEQPYCRGEIEWLVNESKTGQLLHPRFTDKNAQKLLDRLVRNGKITVQLGQTNYYVLPPKRI